MNIQATDHETEERFAGVIDLFKAENGKTGIDACVPSHVAFAMFFTEGAGWRWVSESDSFGEIVLEANGVCYTEGEERAKIKNNNKISLFEAHVPAEVANRMLAHAEQAGATIRR